jgi:hypothetical protein
LGYLGYGDYYLEFGYSFWLGFEGDRYGVYLRGGGWVGSYDGLEDDFFNFEDGCFTYLDLSSNDYYC